MHPPEPPIRRNRKGRQSETHYPQKGGSRPRAAVLRSGGLPSLFTYAALGNGMFSTLSVPSGLAVIRVRQPFWTISTTRRSWLMSQTRLSFRFFIGSIDAPPFFGTDKHHLHFFRQLLVGTTKIVRHMIRYIQILQIHIKNEFLSFGGMNICQN